MSLIEVLFIVSLVAMTLNLLENTLVAVIATLIYRKQQQANAEMEERISKAIVEVKEMIDIESLTKPIIDEVKSVAPTVKKTLSGWWANKFSQGSKAVKETAKEFDDVPLSLKLVSAKKEDRMSILLAHAADKMLQGQQQQQMQQIPVDQLPTPEEYAKSYAEAMQDAKIQQKKDTD